MKTNKFLCMLLTLVILLGTFTIPVMAEENIKVILNGTELSFDVPPQLINNRTMVPMRKIFESLGATVGWDDSTQTITAKTDDIVIIMQIDNVIMSVSEKEITLDVPPQLVDSRTLVPVRAVAEGLDADVKWDGDTQTVIITKEGKPIHTPTPTTEQKPARYPEEGELYGYGNDGIAELQYNARYMFEQVKLPQTVFEFEKETIDYINASNINKIKENILGVWELAAADVILNDLKLSGGKVPETEDLIWELVDETRPKFGLGDEHIVDVTIEKINSDTNAIIVKVLDTNWSMLSTYIGIAYNKTMGLMYFTLERSLDLMENGNIPYMFCHVEDGSRGSYYSIKNDKLSFINAIKDVMDNSSDSNVNSDEIDGVKCTLNITIYVMDIAKSDIGLPTRALVSVYDDKGKDITSKLTFGKIQLTKGKDTNSGIVNTKDNYEYKFMSNWKVGENVDVTVEVKDSKGKTITLSAENVKVKGFEDSLQDLLGPNVKIEIN